MKQGKISIRVRGMWVANRLMLPLLGIMLFMFLTGLTGCTYTELSAEDATGEIATETAIMSETEPANDLSGEISALFGTILDQSSLVTLSLEIPDSAAWKTKELSAQSGTGAYYDNYITASFNWQELTEQTPPESPAYILTISDESGASYFQFYGGEEVVLYSQDGAERWFSVVPNEEDTSISEFFRAWYDSVEFDTAKNSLAISGDITDFDQVATAYGEGLAAAFLNLTPGSAHAVTAAQLYSAEVYDIIEGDDTQFCFTLTLEVQPVAVNTIAWMSGAGLESLDNGTEDGRWLWTRQVQMKKVGALWYCVGMGTGGCFLSDEGYDAAEGYN